MGGIKISYEIIEFHTAALDFLDIVLKDITAWKWITPVCDKSCKYFRDIPFLQLQYCLDSLGRYSYFAIEIFSRRKGICTHAARERECQLLKFFTRRWDILIKLVFDWFVSELFQVNRYNNGSISS